MSELLPCPFCGSDAVKTWSHAYGDCAHCGNDECAASAFYDRVMVSEWNKRHTPDGWQMVPVRATPKMKEAGQHPKAIIAGPGHFQANMWIAMLDAAPKPGGDDGK